MDTQIQFGFKKAVFRHTFVSDISENIWFEYLQARFVLIK